MTLAATLLDVWRQVLVEERAEVDLDGTKVRVGRSRSSGLRTVALTAGDRTVQGIEQNPAKPSVWGAKARAGAKILQFKVGPKYIGNVCDGHLTRYAGWTSLGLPE